MMLLLLIPAGAFAHEETDSDGTTDTEDNSWVSRLALEQHEKNYFTIGSIENEDGTEAFSGNDIDAKFQISMRVRIIDYDKAPFYFAYTQRSWWDIGESSLPFAESNYLPELLALWQVEHSDRLTAEYRVSAWEHESNGEGADDSRSWNKSYAQARFVQRAPGPCDESSTWYCQLVPNQVLFGGRIWESWSESDNNKDIEDFLGHGRVTLGFGRGGKYSVELTLSKGDEVSRYNQQLDITYSIWRRLGLDLFITYYRGYGEAMISYNQVTDSLHAGFVLRPPLDR